MSFARRSSTLAFLITIAGCASVQPHSDATPARTVTRAPLGLRELSPDEQVTHVLSRLTFGGRPGDFERVAAIGVDAWIAAQLKPESIADDAVVMALASNASWAKPTDELTPASLVTRLTFTPAPVVRRTDSIGRALPADSLKALVAKVALSRVLFSLNPGDQFAGGKFIHAQLGERQLFEVIADFWENHFSIYAAKMPSPEALPVWDRAAIRPFALGKFRDLLGAVAHSPAMLFYLDNHLSQRGALNENYAREILELHTLGVDGGYTQQDVVAVARALTGWTIAPVGLTAANRNVKKEFVFNSATHDIGEKIVLGHKLAAGRGIEDGEDVLDIIARHPSTAHYIALKLSRHLVSDDPPASIVDRAAATFTNTNGDIAEVVRTIVTSPEFFSRAAFRAKVKTPFELLASTRRAFDAPADSTAGTVQLLRAMGQPVFGRGTPDGWPDRGEAWMTPGAMYNRITFGSDAAAGRLKFLPVEQWTGWEWLATAPADSQAAGVIHLLLGRIAAPATREVLLATQGTATAAYPDSARSRLREMVAIALGSPEFQRR